MLFGKHRPLRRLSLRSRPMGAKALNFEFHWCLGPGAWAAQGFGGGGACVCVLRSPSATPELHVQPPACFRDFHVFLRSSSLLGVKPVGLQNQQCLGGSAARRQRGCRQAGCRQRGCKCRLLDLRFGWERAAAAGLARGWGCVLQGSIKARWLFGFAFDSQQCPQCESRASGW